MTGNRLENISMVIFFTDIPPTSFMDKIFGFSQMTVAWNEHTNCVLIPSWCLIYIILFIYGPKCSPDQDICLSLGNHITWYDFNLP